MLQFAAYLTFVIYSPMIMLRVGSIMIIFYDSFIALVIRSEKFYSTGHRIGSQFHLNSFLRQGPGGGGSGGKVYHAIIIRSYLWPLCPPNPHPKFNPKAWENLKPGPKFSNIVIWTIYEHKTPYFIECSAHKSIVRTIILKRFFKAKKIILVFKNVSTS